MKRKILLAIIFLTIIFIPSVRADGNMKVIFNTSFEEQIDINKIDEIFIMMDDVNRKDYQLVLYKKDNFHLELNNLPNGDIVINSINVARDYTVEYDYDYTITKPSEEEMVVSLLVTKIEKDPNRPKVNIDKEKIAEMLGYDPLNNPTNGIFTSPSDENTTTSSSEVPSDPDEPVDINPNKTTSSSTTLSEQEIEKIENEKKEEEREEAKKKRNSIYLVVILVIIAIILVVGVIVGIKIANANK